MLNLIRKIFHIKEEKDWLNTLFENFELAWLQDRRLRFKIIDIKDKGFLVKVGGLFAYLSFQNMPWSYKLRQYWQVIFPSLAGKVFYCKITKAEKIGKNKFNLLVDASVHLFRPIELSEDIPYSGIILQKFNYGVLVEIGNHFNWWHGSIVGLLHKNSFSDKQLLELCEIGQTISVHYQCQTEKGFQFIEAGLYPCINWYSDKMKAYVGCEVFVRVDKTYDQIVLLVDDCYPARFRLQAKMLKKYNLEEKDIIFCTVAAIDYKNHCFKLDLTESAAHSTRILNRIDSKTLQQLKTLSQNQEENAY